MSKPRMRALQATAILVGTGLVAVLGCGDDSGLGKRYSVSGTVTHKGQPLTKGRIDFRPVDVANGRPATGEIRDGSYSLTTLVPGDGALPGDYKVTISAKVVDNTQVIDTVTKKGGGGRQHEIAQANQAAKSEIPSKYSLADTSGLTATVEARANSIPFDLKDF